MIEPKFSKSLFYSVLVALIILAQGIATEESINSSLNLLETFEIPRHIVTDTIIDKKAIIPLKADVAKDVKLTINDKATIYVETSLTGNLFSHPADSDAEDLRVGGKLIFRVSLGHYNQLGSEGTMNLVSGPHVGEFASVEAELRFDTCEELTVTQNPSDGKILSVSFKVDTKKCESSSINNGTLTGVIICSIIFGFMLGFFILTFVSWRLRKSNKGTNKAAMQARGMKDVGPKDKEDITENGEEDSVMQSDEEEAEDIVDDDDENEDFSSESSDDYDDDDDDDGFSSSSESDYDTTSS